MLLSVATPVIDIATEPQISYLFENFVSHMTGKETLKDIKVEDECKPRKS